MVYNKQQRSQRYNTRIEELRAAAEEARNNVTAEEAEQAEKAAEAARQRWKKPRQPSQKEAAKLQKLVKAKGAAVLETARGQAMQQKARTLKYREARLADKGTRTRDGLKGTAPRVARRQVVMA